MIRVVVLVAMLASLSIAAGPAQACLACYAMPEDTLADHVMEADVVALMREDPDRPFRYSLVRTLKGQGISRPLPPFLVDTTVRAALDSDTTVGVIGTWSAARGWQHHGLASPRLQTVLAQVVTSAPGWVGESGDAARFSLLAPHHADPDPTVQDLALGEVARVPYSLLRQLTPRLDRREVAARLSDLRWAEWAAVHVLILGLSDHPADRAFVRRGAQLVLSDERRANPVAWATAWIEADGIDAINAIERSCIQDPQGPATLRQAAGLALLNFATVEDAALRSRALAVLRSAALRHPDLAAAAAQAMTLARDWTLAPHLTVLLDSGAIAAPDEAFLVGAYVAAAERSMLLSEDTSHDVP